MRTAHVVLRSIIFVYCSTHLGVNENRILSIGFLSDSDDGRGCSFLQVPVVSYLSFQ